MGQLSKDEGNLVAKKGGRVFKSTRESMDSGDGSRQVGRRSQVAQRKHGSVADEKWAGCVHQVFSEIFDCLC